MAGTVSQTLPAETNRFAKELANRLNVLHGDVMADYKRVLQQDCSWQELAEKLQAENHQLRDQLGIMSERQEGDIKLPLVSVKGIQQVKCNSQVSLDLNVEEVPPKHQQSSSCDSTSSVCSNIKAERRSGRSVTENLHVSQRSHHTLGMTSSVASDALATLASTSQMSTVTVAHMEAHTYSIKQSVETLAIKFEEELTNLVTRLGLSDMGIHLQSRPRPQRPGAKPVLHSLSSNSSVGHVGHLQSDHQLASPAPLAHKRSESNLRAYELWPAWTPPDLEENRTVSTTSCRLQRHFTHFEISENEAKKYQGDSSNPVQDSADSRRRCAFTINPNSRRRMAWETLGICTLLFDLITIPLLVFDPPRWVFMEVMSWVTLIYWTLDIFASLLVGYHEHNGLLVMNPRRIAVHYLKTWFLFDIIIGAVDWASSVASTRRVNIGKIIRVIRISRFLRLVRLMKLMRFFDEIRMRIDSEYVALLLELLQYMAFILAANHFIACAWYWIASVSAPGPNWVDIHGFKGRDIFYLYTTSLHWSLTQFTPASMAVQPENEKERTFAVVVLIFALIIFGSFVSSLTSAMTTLRQLDRKSTGQFWLLRKYLRQHAITRDLALRTIRYLTHTVLRQRKYIEEHQVPVLALLSEPLRDNLRRELYSPSITRHPFFEIYRQTSPAVLQHVCGNCVHEEHLSRGDVLFHHSSPATHMFILEVGSLVYFHMIESALPAAVEVGQYFCEAVLWTPWMHRGEMCAKTECRMCALDSAKFRETVLQHVQDLELPMKYAAAFVEILDGLSEEDESEVTDLQEGIKPNMELFETLAKNHSTVSLTSNSLRALNALMQGVLSPFDNRGAGDGTRTATSAHSDFL